MSSIDDLAKILREDENYTGDTEQAKALITKLMVRTAEPKSANLQPELKYYAQYENVEVMRNGDWIPGRISAIERVSGNLYVHTERGPVTIASPRTVRKLA